VMIAGNPDYCQINPKYGQKFSVRRFCGVIITTNHLASGIYIPADDRRYDVIEAATKEEMVLEDDDKRRIYFTELWDWFNSGGAGHVAAYLHERDIKGFSAANGQRKTEAHRTVVVSGMTSDHWLADILEELGGGDGVRLDCVIEKAVAAGEKVQGLQGRIPPALNRLGYVLLKNKGSGDGRWRLGGKLAVVYVKAGALKTFDPLKGLGKEMF